MVIVFFFNLLINLFFFLNHFKFHGEPIFRKGKDISNYQVIPLKTTQDSKNINYIFNV